MYNKKLLKEILKDCDAEIVFKKNVSNELRFLVNKRFEKWIKETIK